MKIKTIKRTDADAFDRDVNAALAEGYQLHRRFVISTGYLAELVKHDPPAQQDPFEALHAVKDYCQNVPTGACATEQCELFYWCQQLRAGGDPTDWILPEVAPRE